MDHVRGDSASYAQADASDALRKVKELDERITVIENFLCEKLGFNKDFETMRNREFLKQMKLYQDMDSNIESLRNQYHSIERSIKSVDNTMDRVADFIETMAKKLQPGEEDETK